MHFVSLHGFKFFIYKKTTERFSYEVGGMTWQVAGNYAQRAMGRPVTAGCGGHPVMTEDHRHSTCLLLRPSWHTLYEKPGRHVRFVFLTHRSHVSRSTVHVIPPKNRRTICFTVFTPRPCLNITRKRAYILVSGIKRQF